jgi:hypothetical protein
MWAGAIALSFLAAGCGPGEARAPNPTRPLEEQRAVELVRRAMRSLGVEPGPARDDRLVGRAELMHIDVGVQGKLYGVAFLTEQDQKELGDAVTPNGKDEKLKIKATEGKARLLLLFQQNYVYDDLVGEGHAQTAITAENALTRDVREYLLHARTNHFE